MTRTLISLPLVMALLACSPPVPNSAGPGFTDLTTERARRDAALQGQPGLPGGPVVSGEDVAALDGAALDDMGAPRAPVDTARISDEQDFDAVAERETIESDAERIARQREAYTVIQPTALPERSGSGRPNIVEFALTTTHALGQQVYRRSSVNAENRFVRACGRFASADLAQEAFLADGGPERDRRGMDPDGDGFACNWDPTPFRAARTAGNSGR
ncbi:MAG: hypothetical protein AAFR34_12305 [Pseudomonadota bacterium]